MLIGFAAIRSRRPFGVMIACKPIGDPAQIRAKQVRKQKNHRRDAEHILKLMLKDDFPRI